MMTAATSAEVIVLHKIQPRNPRNNYTLGM